MVFWAPKAFLSPDLPFTAYPVCPEVSIQLFHTAAAVFCCHCMVLASSIDWGVHGQHLHSWPPGLSSGTLPLPHGISSLSPLCLQSWVSTATETLPLKRMADGFSWHLVRDSSPCIQTFLFYDLFMPESYTLSGLTVSMRYTALAYSGPQLLTPRKYSREISFQCAIQSAIQNFVV